MTLAKKTLLHLESLEDRCTPAVAIDLTPTLVHGPSSAARSSTIAVSSAVDNRAVDVSGGFQVSYYLSRDLSITASDTLLKTVSRPSLAGNSTQQWAEAIALPAGLSAGKYYLGMCADPSNALAETNEVNNTKATSLQITTGRPTTVDLSGQKIIAPGLSQWGQVISVQSRLRNNGTGASGDFQVQWYLARDAIGSANDILLTRADVAETSFRHGSIAANSNGPLFTVKLQLPSSLPAGWTDTKFFLLQKTDSTATVAESNEGNNFGQVGAALDRAAIVVLGNTIKGRITATLPGHEHLPAINVFLQRISADANGNSVMNLSIQPKLQTWVVIHGRVSTSADMHSLAAAIDGYKPGDQVLVLDWAEGAADNHEGWVPDELALDGAAWIPYVAQWAKTNLVSLGITSDKLGVIGHSWGTYVAYEIARAMPGQNAVIVALDPAAAAVDYNYTAVNFGAVSRRAWAFYGHDLYGSAALAKTADESFVLDYDESLLQGIGISAAHHAPVNLFESLVRANNLGTAASRADLFTLDRLETGSSGPWRLNAYSSGFEGVFTIRDADEDGQWGNAWDEVTAFRYRLLATGQEVAL